MKLKYEYMTNINEKGYIEVKFMSFFKLYFLSYILMSGIYFVFFFIVGFVLGGGLL